MNSVLESWHALLVLYMQQSHDKQAEGFETLLTNKTNLELLAFIADVPAVFSRFQKKIQSNNVTLLDIQQEVTLVKTSISSLQKTPLLGGWVSSLQAQSQLVESDERSFYMLKGIKLTSDEPRRRRGHHLFVADRRNLSAIKVDVTEALK